MGKIVLLDELTINQIAAGEVIERPASVVKELVENSIDAGAKNIVVEIKKGGIELIKIIDDGCGIAEDDMEISFERHATSKIRSSRDLETVTSMGFRGEALASVAAISKIEMISKTSNEETGHRIVVEGGQVKETGEIGCRRGTTITVQNLFYNTPVRYKFLRKDYTESGYIEDVITRIALINKNVAIKYINSGKTIIQTSGNNDIKSVVYNIYGKDIANNILEIEYEYEGMKVSGVIGNPEISRGNRSYQLFFVNGRYVKDKNLTSAVDQAYKDLLPVNKYGFVILNLEIDPKAVDVNVHPAKLEVRFENESLVFKAIYHAIKAWIVNMKPLKEDIDNNFELNERRKNELNISDIMSKYDYTSKYNSTSNFTNTSSFDNTNKVEEINKVIDNNEDNTETQKIDKIEINEEKVNSNKENNNDFKENEVEEKRNFAEIKPEEDLVQPKMRSGFAGFLKKVMGNDDDEREEYDEGNLVEAIFEARNGKKRATPIFEDGVDNNNEKNENFEENNSFNFTSEIKEDNDNPFNTNVANNNVGEAKDEKNSISTAIDEEEAVDGKAVKIGKVSISSETKGVEVNIDEIIKKRMGDVKENNKIEFVKDDNKNDDNEEAVLVNDEPEKEDNPKENINDIVQESLSNIDKLTDSIVRNKLENSFDSTQELETEPISNEVFEIHDTEPKASPEITPEFAEMYKKTFGKDIVKKNEENVENIEAYNDFLNSQSGDNLSVFENVSYSADIKYRFVGRVFDSYFIIEIGNEMYIIDQKLAYERIVYEKVKENYYNEFRKDSQMLLLPDIISLNKKEFLIAGENIEMFEKAGFGFEEFGENTIKLFAVPALCEKLNTKQLFIDILDGLDSVAITEKKEKEEKFLSTIAYKSAIKARINLDSNEINDIINSLLKLNNPFVCYDNKQIAIKMSKVDFEKKFNRR